MKNATKILSAEHQNILTVIDSVLKECGKLDEGAEINNRFFGKAVDFIKNYADKFHHAKEEDILFAELNKDGVLSHCNPTKQMLHEHDLGREFVRGLEEALEKADKNGVIDNTRGYGELLRDHIFKEDNILYPMADEVLSEEAQKSIMERFSGTPEMKFNKEDWGN